MVDAKMVDKVGVATIVVNKATWPVTVQRIDRHHEDRSVGNQRRTRREATWPVTVHRIDRHPEDESVGNQGRTRGDEIKVEIARDGFDPAPKAEKGPQRPRRHFQRPGGGPPREELNTTTSTNKPEKNSTLGGVNVEGTEPEHASLFMV